MTTTFGERPAWVVRCLARLADRIRLAALVTSAGLLSVFSASSGLEAQGVSTVVVRGTVLADDGTRIDDALVEVANIATGYRAALRVRQGRFLVQGLEAGGPYVVTIRRPGFHPVRSEAVTLKLGAPLELAFVMRPQAAPLEGVTVGAARGFPRSNAHGGTTTTIADSLVQRLPTLDRNLYDFVGLAPQVSTNVGFGRTGVSAAGANFRYNRFLINGADEQAVGSNLPAAFSGGKSVPLAAVKEYELLIAPYDVRYGEFAGALVNTVTQSGTNEWRGSAFALWRNDGLARSGETSRSPYDRLQYGFALGGPILRDRAHFFISPEFQRLTSPAAGPYVGQPPGAMPPVPVTVEDLARFDQAMRQYGLAAGSGGVVEVGQPLRNLFARVDVTLPEWGSRAMAFISHAGAAEEEFSRGPAPDTFALSSHKLTFTSSQRIASMQLYTDFAGTGGAHNELVVSHSAERGIFEPAVRQPLVRVLTPNTSGGTVALNTGAVERAQGRFANGWSLRIRDDASLPLGTSHVLRAGLQAEQFLSRRGGVNGAYGVWTFGSLDAFERGVAERYELRRNLESGSTSLRGAQYAAWLSDEWRPGDNLAITMGVRADRLAFKGHAPYSAPVDSIFGRRTDEMPRARVHFSPRVGFTWDPFGSGRDQLRGGAGLFTGRPPLAWISPSLSSYGIGIGRLRCGLLPGDDGLPPPFEPDYRAAPTACATGPGLAAVPRGEVALLDRRLRMAQALRVSLAWDRRLPWHLLATSEVLYSRHTADFMFVNLNLQGPQHVDHVGRVMYGTIGATGIAEPVLRSPRFAEVIDLRNTSKNHAIHLSARLERTFTRGLAATASYTWSRTRDVQSPSRVNLAGITMWADARAVSGRHESLRRGTSLNDLPHRVVAALTYTAPWRRAPTSVGFSYVGESGSPFTYLARGVGPRGDLNADGSNANDPIHVPLDAFRADEILFDGRSSVPDADNSPAAQTRRVSEQQTAFEQFIRSAACLRTQRGRILERNSCRAPWSHTTIAAARQTVPIGDRVLEVGLDLFNVLNFLNRRWGRNRIAMPGLLEHVGQTTGPAGTTQPIVRFDATRAQWTTLETASAFQLQLAARYRF